MDHASDSIVVDAGTEPRPKRRRRRGPVNSRSPSPPPPPAAPDPSTLPLEAHPPYDPAESIETALARFKAWMRAGAPHDERCFACKEPGGVDCATCRRSYHDHCRPSESPGPLDTDAWFCHICVGRGWQANPPHLTPPASHIQSPAAEPSATERRTVLPSSRRRRSRSPEQRSTAGTSAPEAPQEPERATRTRKSRYTTLPKDVDGALRILYTELECAGEARQEVDRLNKELALLKQELELGRKQLDLERKVSQSARALQQEVSRLRAEAAQQQVAADEIATLKREKQQTEAELRDTKAELEKMKNTLQEWKRSLSSLVNMP